MIGSDMVGLEHDRHCIWHDNKTNISSLVIWNLVIVFVFVPCFLITTSGTLSLCEEFPLDPKPLKPLFFLWKANITSFSTFMHYRNIIWSVLSTSLKCDCIWISYVESSNNIKMPNALLVLIGFKNAIRHLLQKMYLVCSPHSWYY